MAGRRGRAPSLFIVNSQERVTTQTDAKLSDPYPTASVKLRTAQIPLMAYSDEVLIKMNRLNVKRGEIKG